MGKSSKPAEGMDQEDTKKGLLSKQWDFSQIGVTIRGYAFLSGISLTFLLFLLGDFLEIWRIEFLSHTRWIHALATVYAGMSSGYYLGRAGQDQGQELDVDSFLLGFFITLSVGVVLSARLLTLTAILAVAFFCVTTLYRTELIQNDNEFERKIEYVRRLVLVVFIGLVSYNIVLALTSGQPMDGQNQLTSIIAILGIAVVLLILPVVLKLPYES